MSETYNPQRNAMAKLLRRAAGAVAVFCAAVLSLLPAHAVEIDINRGTVDPLPIAITDFVGGEGQEAKVGASSRAWLSSWRDALRRAVVGCVGRLRGEGP